ncbi:hypothetical protein [Spirillospora sp. CA-294931]|uniref:hypothetical protein n=1 Tax=Spirillospora sp. CA-294931 TaxID=3240042 RepID=UPI003D8A6CB1
MDATQAAGQPESATNPYVEAQAVMDDLRDALTTAGIKLPSLGLDSIPTRDGAVLVELGRCNFATARKLAEAVRRGAAPDDPDPDAVAHLAGLAGMLRGHGYTADADADDGTLLVTYGPESRGVTLECRTRPDDGDRWWFCWAGGIWICEADKPIEALVTVKAALRRVDA